MNIKERLHAVVDKHMVDTGNGVKTFMPYDAAYLADVQKVHDENEEENKEELAIIRANIDEVDAEMSIQKQLSAEAAQKLRKRNSIVSGLYKVIGKEVGIKMKFFTGSGNLSHAKLRGAGLEEAEQVMDLFNNEFIPKYNARTDELAKDPKMNMTEDEANIINTLNQTITKRNALVRQLTAITG